MLSCVQQLPNVLLVPSVAFLRVAVIRGGPLPGTEEDLAYCAYQRVPKSRKA